MFVFRDHYGLCIFYLEEKKIIESKFQLERALGSFESNHSPSTAMSLNAHLHCLHTYRDSDSTSPNNSFHAEIFPYIQFKPPLMQFEAIFSPSIILAEEANPHLTTASFQIVRE